MSCEACDAAKDHGHWTDVVPSASTHCRDCHATFSGRAMHCTICHETLSMPFGLGRATLQAAQDLWDTHIKACLKKEKKR